MRWYAARNRLWRESGLGEDILFSVPLNLKEYQLVPFFEEAKNRCESWKIMKLIVLGHGGIGKSTLMYRLKEYVQPVC